MAAADILSAISAAVAFLALLVSFFSFHRSAKAERHATQSEFQTIRNEIGIISVKLVNGETRRKQQIQELLEGCREVLRMEKTVAHPQLMQAGLDIQDSVAELSRQVEDTSIVSDLRSLQEQLDTLLVQEVTSSALIQLQELLGMHQKQLTRTEEWEAAIVNQASRLRGELDRLRRVLEELAEEDEDDAPVG